MLDDDADSAKISPIIERARQGDERALEELLQWSRAFLRDEARQTLAPQVRVRVDESDLVQKVCLAAFEQFSDFSGSSGTEYVQWLRRILQRDILDVIDRERNAAKRAVDREVHGSEPIRRAIGKHSSPSHRAIRNEETQIVREAIEQLPEEQREPMRLRHVENLRLSQIAERLDMTEDAVTSHLYRGMKSLKIILQKLGIVR